MSDGEVIKYFLHDFYIKGEICNFNKSVSHSLIFVMCLVLVHSEEFLKVFGHVQNAFHRNNYRKFSHIIT